jgi:hypothetical protein
LRIIVACTWFLARVRCLTSCARAEIRRRRIRVCSSGSHTAGRKPPASSFASVRVDLVGLRARPRDPLDRLRIREHHASDVRLDDPRDLKRVAGHLKRDLIITAEALREQRQRLRLGLHPRGQPHRARLRDRDLAEVAMHVQPDESHQTPPPSSVVMSETRRATRQLRIRARGTPGQSQGRPPTNSGLAAHNE